MRLTKQREAILKVLRESSGTLSAADVHESLPGIDLVTIYRNLDRFTREGWIKRVALNTREVQYEHQKEPHHHAVCSQCDRVVHFSAPTERIKKLLNLSDFEIQDIDVTVHGRCMHDKHATSS